MTDLTKVLDEQFASLKADLTETQEARANANSDELRKEFEDRLAQIEASIEKTKASRKEVERQGLPGLEYAEKGETDKFSIFRAMQLAEDAQQNPRAWDNPYYGTEVKAMQEIREKGGYQAPKAKTMNTGTDTAGGVFVPHQVLYSSIIPSLEELAVIYQAGARRLDGIVGELTWIVDQGGTAAFYIDNPSEESATETRDTFKTIKGQAHTMSARTRLTRDMLTQSAVAMEPWVRAQIAEQFALREDLSAFKGTGVGSEPRGIVNVSGINSVDFSGITQSGADQAMSPKLRDMIYKIRLAKYRAANGSFSWVAQPEVGQRIGDTRDGEGRPFFIDENQGELTSLMGRQFIDTTQVDNADTADGFLLYGDFAQCLMLHWGTLQLEMGTENDDLRRGVRTVVGFMDHDVIVQQPKAFTLASAFSIA